MKAMIFAAGLGTRLKPFTDHAPKALAPIGGVTMLEITIQRLVAVGCNHIVVNVHHFAQQIVDFLHSKNNFGIQISVSDETDLLLETGGGLKKASPFFEHDTEPFFVHNADVFTTINLEALYQAHVQSGAIATLAVGRRKSSRCFLFDNNMLLHGWTNNSTGELRMSRNNDHQLTQYAFSGIHVVSPALLPLITEQGKFSIVDTYLRVAAQHNIYGFDHSNDVWIDIGDPEKLAEAQKIVNQLIS